MVQLNEKPTDPYDSLYVGQKKPSSAFVVIILLHDVNTRQKTLMLLFILLLHFFHISWMI